MRSTGLRPTLRLVAALCAVLASATLALAACGDDDDTAEKAADEAPTTGSTATDAAPAGEGATVSVPDAVACLRESFPGGDITVQSAELTKADFADVPEPEVNVLTDPPPIAQDVEGVEANFGVTTEASIYTFPSAAEAEQSLDAIMKDSVAGGPDGRVVANAVVIDASTSSEPDKVDACLEG